MTSRLATPSTSAKDYFGMDMMLCLTFLFFPLFGMMADLWIGRYKVIMIGMVLCFLQWLTSGIAFTVYGLVYNSELFLSWMYGIVYLACTASFCCIKSNIIQYNTDQFIGASSDELKSIIYWHLAVSLTSGLFLSVLSCFGNYTSGIFLTLVLVSHSFFKHKLENVSLIKNPIKLIVRVLCYARKHKYPENRSALTYWEEKAPSRLDLGKDKYGGPFTEEEVEDVKTFFHMLPLFIAVIGFACSDESFVTN
uniref:Uncharacterized protein n=1 Tax=Amphimedon queenslandica TaxID=400682 RepID=A0A1X7VEI1_AMPQE